MGNLNFLMVAVLALFAIFMVIGYSKGFLRMAVSLTGIIMSIFLTTQIVPNLSSLLVEMPAVHDLVYDQIINIFHDVNANYNRRTTEEQNRAIESYELPELIRSDLIVNNTKEVYESLKVKVFEEYIGNYLTRMIIRSGTFVAVYALFAVTMWIVLHVTGLIARIPIIHGVNKTLGILTGLFFGVIFVWIAFFVIMMLYGNSIAGTLLSDISSSKFLTFLFDSNILFQVVK